jgi:GNAT superfamily N-acetyltransferase
MPPLSPAIPALVESLFPDPFYQAISVDFEGDMAARKQVLGHYFQYALDEAARTGRRREADPPDLGAAAWLLPRAADIDAAESAAKTAALAALLGPNGNRNYHRIVDFMGPRAAGLVPAGAWYLSIVGVLPAAQGRGLGLQLLQPTLDEAGRAGAVCYLETFTPGNMAFYERLGFRSVGVFDEPVTGSAYAVMRRDA